MKEWPFAVFVAGSFFICIPLQFYYAWTNPFLNEIGVKNAAAWMILGQGSEVFFMLIMPLIFARLGVKYMLLVGMLAWSLRYVLFAYGTAEADLPRLDHATARYCAAWHLLRFLLRDRPDLRGQEGRQGYSRRRTGLYSHL